MDGAGGEGGRLLQVVHGDWLSRTRAARRGRLRQVPVLLVLGKGASAASVGSDSGLRASAHACSAAVARTDGSGRQRGLTVGADGEGRWQWPVQ